MRSSSLYSITMTGALYRGLWDRDAFHNDNPVDLAALAVFKTAERVRAGSGYRYTLTGTREEITYILGYLHSLAELVREKVITADELGVTIAKLEAAAGQKPRWEVPDAG